ncbi:MAG: hypothetical protein ACI9ND_001322 [Yoonia sp.]|jgi:hypothetical protein
MIYAILTAIFAASFIISPAFTSFSGFEATQLPFPQVDPPIQPAGYAFSIWGLIYGWLIVSSVYGLWKRGDDPAWNRARPFLIASFVIGTPWLYVATQNPILATIMIILMAATAITALLRAPKFDRWWFQAPVGIYAGWLTAASFVSLGSTMAGYGIIFGSLGWAYVGIIGALVVSLAVYSQRRAPGYLLTIIWALVGIIVANQDGEASVVWLAQGGIAALLIVMFWTYRRARLSRPY